MAEAMGVSLKAEQRRTLKTPMAFFCDYFRKLNYYVSVLTQRGKGLQRMVEGSR
jgi:hypothetical protein